jgi:hypothetical protein
VCHPTADYLFCDRSIKRTMIEQSLYKPVAQFIEKEFGCFAIDTTKGTQYGSIDVVGLRYVMGDYGGAAEVVGVEVKPESATFLKSIGQARAYSVMADRCYLAVHKPYRRKFSQEELDIAAQLNVGLIEIGKGKSCRVVVSSPKHEPIRAHKLALIKKLGFVECVLCGSLFRDQGLRSQRERSSIRNAIVEKKAFRYWLFKLASQRGSNKKKYIYDRRHICEDCVHALSGLVGP